MNPDKKGNKVGSTVLSGIRATGRMHFGNFVGAVDNFVRYQANPENTCMYFVADLHTLTTLEDPEELRRNLVEMVKDYLAAGLDPDKSIIYAQSSIPEIPELMLLLGMFQPLGELQLIPTYKDLVKNNPDRITHGLLSYPVLMAADILGPQANLVPVGSDQSPNVELARDLAVRFNNRFGTTFAVPEMMKEMVKVPGLDGHKMGKSSSDNAIGIGDTAVEIRSKYLKRGITDTNKARKNDPGDPYNGCKSVYAVHEMVTEGERETRTIANLCRSGQIGCVECKNMLVDGIAAILEPFQQRRAELDNQNDYVTDVLVEGGNAARAVIAQTVEDVRTKMGIVRYV